jgi:hypothetical protein
MLGGGCNIGRGRVLAILRRASRLGLRSADAGPALSSVFAFDSGVSVSVLGAHDRFRQVGVTFIGIALQNRESDDLAFVVDGACGLQG